MSKPCMMSKKQTVRGWLPGCREEGEGERSEEKERGSVERGGWRLRKWLGSYSAGWGSNSEIDARKCKLVTGRCIRGAQDR